MVEQRGRILVFFFFFLLSLGCLLVAWRNNRFLTSKSSLPFSLFDYLLLYILFFILFLIWNVLLYI